MKPSQVAQDFMAPGGRSGVSVAEMESLENGMAEGISEAPNSEC